MNILLDTDTCIYLINKRHQKILGRLRRFSPDSVFISSITVAELYYGMEKSKKPPQNLKALDEFLTSFEILAYSKRHSKVYGKIRAELEKAGKIIGPYDMMIASQAICENMRLISNNLKEFKRVKKLKVETWV